jgi:hypothetical protein
VPELGYAVILTRDVQRATMAMHSIALADEVAHLHAAHAELWQDRERLGDHTSAMEDHA